MHKRLLLKLAKKKDKNASFVQLASKYCSWFMFLNFHFSKTRGLVSPITLLVPTKIADVNPFSLSTSFYRPNRHFIVKFVCNEEKKEFCLWYLCGQSWKNQCHFFGDFILKVCRSEVQRKSSSRFSRYWLTNYIQIRSRAA